MSGAFIGGTHHLLSGSAKQQAGPTPEEGTGGRPGIRGTTSVSPTAFHLLLVQSKQQSLHTEEGKKEKKPRLKHPEHPQEAGLAVAAIPGSTVPLLAHRSPQVFAVQSTGGRGMPSVAKAGETPGTAWVQGKDRGQAAISGRAVDEFSVLRERPGRDGRSSGILQDGRGDVDGVTVPAPQTVLGQVDSGEPVTPSTRVLNPRQAENRPIPNGLHERATTGGNGIAVEVVRSEPPTVAALASRGAEFRKVRPTEDGVDPARPLHRLERETNLPLSGPPWTGGTGNLSPVPSSAQESAQTLTNVPIEQIGDRVGEWFNRHPWTPEDVVTLRVTVVPADLGPVQVVARMDADGQLHLQIHTANQDVQSLIQQQVGQLIGHLQQNHIPVHRIEVVNNPAVTGTIGQTATFDGSAGSWQQGRRPPEETSVPGAAPNPVAGGTASGDSQTEAVYRTTAADRLLGSNTFEVVI
ncbi:MAG: flagellar hook-length control protein FliK [Alicyclobacillaceae bacterium]|nr:flagellar hook-length control protein FliK [Alicyclobacillaceae bacterium]